MGFAEAERFIASSSAVQQHEGDPDTLAYDGEEEAERRTTNFSTTNLSTGQLPDAYGNFVRDGEEASAVASQSSWACAGQAEPARSTSHCSTGQPEETLDSAVPDSGVGEPASVMRAPSEVSAVCSASKDGDGEAVRAMSSVERMCRPLAAVE